MPEQDTSLGSAFRHAVDQPFENAAATFKALGWHDTEEFLHNLIEEPENYEVAAAKFINAQGDKFDWRYFPRATFEQLGQIAGSLATRALGAAIGGAVTANPLGAVAGALIGPAAFEAIQIAGPTALEHARNSGREDPTWEDWKYALPATAFSAALNAFGIRNVGVLNNIGGSGVKQAAKSIGKAGISEGGTETLQSISEQIGGSAGTPAAHTALSFKEAIGEGLLGTGAAVSTQTAPATLEAVMGDIIDPSLGGEQFAGEEITEEFPIEKAVVEEIEEDPVEQQRLELTEKYPETTKRVPVEEALFLQPQTLDTLEPQILEIEERIGRQLSEPTPEVAEKRKEALAEVINEINADPALYQLSVDLAHQNTSSLVDTTVARLQDTERSPVEQDILHYEDPIKKLDDLYGKRPVWYEHTMRDISGSRNQQAVGTVQQELTPQQKAILIEGSKGTIEPTFLTHSPLEQYIIKTVGNKNIPAAKMIKNLALFKEDRGWFKELKSSKKRLSDQAIDSGIAGLLKGKRLRGETVNKQDLLDQLIDHRSRFQTLLFFDTPLRADEYSDTLNPDYPQLTLDSPQIEARMDKEVEKIINEDPTKDEVEERILLEEKYAEMLPSLGIVTSGNPEQGNWGEVGVEPFGTRHRGGYQFEWEYSDFMEGGILNNFELWSKYDAKLTPEEEIELADTDFPVRKEKIKQASKEIHKDDDMHAAAGDATNFWVRGHLIKDLQGRVGALLGEIQSKLHGYAQDPNRQRVYRSSVIKQTQGQTSVEGIKHRRHGRNLRTAMDRMIEDPPDENVKLSRWNEDQPMEERIETAKKQSKEDKKGFRRFLLEAVSDPQEGLPANFDDAIHETRYITPLDLQFIRARNGMTRLQEESVEPLRGELQNPLDPDAISNAIREDQRKKAPQQERFDRLIKKIEKVEDRFKDKVEKKEKALVKYWLQSNQPLRPLGVELSKTEINELAGTYVWQNVKRFLMNKHDIDIEALKEAGDPEALAVFEKVWEAGTEMEQKANRAYLQESQEAMRELAPEMAAVSPKVSLLLYANKNAPTREQYQAARKDVAVDERHAVPDYPFKATWPRMAVITTIREMLRARPDITHIWIPEKGYSNAPPGPYRDAIKEAKKIAGQFDLEFEHIEGTAGNPGVWRLEIAPLREKLIPAGGFVGMKEGGLVLPAVNHVMNYGSYGRKIL